MYKIRPTVKYNCNGNIVSGATIMKLLNANPIQTPETQNDFVNVNALVWDATIPFAERLEKLMKIKTSLSQFKTNDRKLKFDIYYKFSTDLSSIKSENKKFHEVELAVEVLKIIKRWERKYNIDIEKDFDNNKFIEFFNDSVDTSEGRLCQCGINYYTSNTVAVKTTIKWANKLCKLGLITGNKFNSYMEYLEKNYGK